MYTTLGAPSGALGGSNGAQSGSESRISTLIVPLNSEPINPTALSSRMPEPFQADTRTSRFEDGNALGRLAFRSRRLAYLSRGSVVSCSTLAPCWAAAEQTG